MDCHGHIKVLGIPSYAEHPASLQVWELQQVQICLKTTVQSSRWTVRVLPTCAPISQEACMRMQGHATQTAVWLSILLVLLYILLKINFLQDSRGTKLSMYFLKAQWTLAPLSCLLQVGGRSR